MTYRELWPMALPMPWMISGILNCKTDGEWISLLIIEHPEAGIFAGQGGFIFFQKKDEKWKRLKLEGIPKKDGVLYLTGDIPNPNPNTRRSSFDRRIRRRKRV